MEGKVKDREPPRKSKRERAITWYREIRCRLRTDRKFRKQFWHNGWVLFWFFMYVSFMKIDDEFLHLKNYISIPIVVILWGCFVVQIVKPLFGDSESNDYEGD